MSAQRNDLPDTTAPREHSWTRSSFSTGMNNCVETARPRRGRCAVRDSKDTARPALLFSSEAWASFVTGIRNGGLGNR